MSDREEKKYFIIAGTNKAATTSFFEYLAAHPQLCPSYIKQTFFFLDKSWQQQLKLSSLYDYEKGFDAMRSGQCGKVILDWSDVK